MPSIIKPTDIVNSLDHYLPEDIRTNFERSASDHVFGQRLATRGLIPVATRVHTPFFGLSAGTATGTTYRSMHYTRSTGRVGFLRLVYCNFHLLTTGETSGANPYNVKASVEYNGAVYPVYFNGARTKTLAIDEVAISDPVMVTIPANTQFHVRQYCSVTTLGEKWPMCFGLNTTLGETFLNGSDVTDTATAMANASGSGFCPAAILGSIAGDAPSVLITGDSMAYGQGDTQEGPNWDLGYLARALSKQFAYVRVVRATTQLSHFLATNSRQLNLIHTAKPTHIIQELSVNDLLNGGNFATVKSRLETMWDILGTTGAKVYQTTLQPVTSSTDNWATTTNQTPHANASAMRDINDFIRSKPPGIAGVIEVGYQMESFPGSGLWKVDGTAQAYTVDGIHLTQRGHRELAATVDFASIFAQS